MLIPHRIGRARGGQMGVRWLFEVLSDLETLPRPESQRSLILLERRYGQRPARFSD